MMASGLAFPLISTVFAPQTVRMAGSVAYRPALHVVILDIPATGHVDRYTTSTVSRMSQPVITARVEVWQYCNSKRFASERLDIQVAPGQPIYRDRPEGDLVNDRIDFIPTNKTLTSKSVS